MKKIMLCLSAATVMTAFMPVVFAQDKKNKIEKEEEIVIKRKGDKDVKISIEINGDDVKINGKPMSNYNDDDIKVDKRVRIIRDGNRDMLMNDDDHGDLFRRNPEFRSLDRLKTMGSIGESRPFLGVTSDKNDKGSKITSVSKGSAAEKAGLKEGDIITKIDSKKITDPEMLMDVVGDLKPKQQVKISYLRDGKSRETSATLGERKDAMVRNFNYDHNWSPEPGGTMMKDFKFTMPAMPDMENMHGDFFMFNRKKLGVRIEDAENEDGAKITKVDSGSAAEKAGLRINDVLTEIDGKKVKTVSEVREQMSEVEKNDYPVKAKRNGTEMTFNVKTPKRIESADL
ncbi:MAG: PDZ domain-containing protein [Ginsengibacter sp.]